MDHENSKKLHEIGRGGHDNLPGSMAGKIPSGYAPRIHFGSSKLKYTMLGKNFKWYENF